MKILCDKTKRSYDYLGCHPQGDGHVFRVWAPGAKAVALVGDHNGWDATAQPMTADPDGVWSIAVSGLQNGQIYKYAVTDRAGHTVFKADPFAFHSETGPATGSKVWDLSQFPWSDREWMYTRQMGDIRTQPVNIYELHLGSWRLGDGEIFPNYQRIAPILAAYCQMMGYTHVELLPVTEYPYEGSWGYQVTGYFAPTSRYGTPQDFMAFVDTLHNAGIGVIIDWVAAHFPRDSHGLARFDGTALYEYADPRLGEHPEWGTLVFDYGKPEIRGFLRDSALFFLDYYHIDGLRCDAVSSMLYLDYGRGPGQWLPNRDGGNINYEVISFWQELNTAIAEEYPGAFTVAEESTAYPGITEAPEAGGLGFTFKWDMGFMHDTLDYFQMDSLFRSHHHQKLTFSMMYAFSERYILAFSHDEVVHGKKSMLDKMFGSYEEKFAALRALYGYQFAHPGKKLTFMGGEFGQFIEWDYKKQLDWFLLKYPSHSAMQAYTAALGQLYCANPALYEIEDSWEGFTWLNPDDNQRSSIAFLRRARSTAQVIVCVCNFTPVPYADFQIGLPGPGILRPLLSSDEARFGGAGLVQQDIAAQPVPFREFSHSAPIPLPALSAQYFEFEEDTSCPLPLQKKN
jgi:1,4-alpha-glucan branching enzyme